MSPCHLWAPRTTPRPKVPIEGTVLHSDRKCIQKVSPLIEEFANITLLG